MKARYRVSVPKTAGKKEARKIAESLKDPGSRLYEQSEQKNANFEFINRDTTQFEAGKFTRHRGPGNIIIVDGVLKKEKPPKYRKPE